MNFVMSLVALLALAVLAAVAYLLRGWLVTLFGMRFSASFLAALVLLGWLGPSSSMFGNLFDEPVHFWPAAFVALTALMACWLGMMIIFIVIDQGRNGPASSNLPVWFSEWRVWWFALPAALIGLRVLQAAECKGAVFGGLLAGLGLALALLWLLTIFYHSMIPPEAPHRRLLLSPHLVPPRFRRADPVRTMPLMTSVARSFGFGVADLKTDGPYAHILAFVSLAGLVVIYLVGGYAAGRLLIAHGYGKLLLPVLVYLILLLLIVAMVLAGAAFWLDPFRVPIVLTIFAVSLTGWLLLRTDHYFSALPFPTEVASGAGSVPRANAPHAIVVVCASGGGAQAEAWTGRVMVGLQRRLGRDFARSIRLISAVSGGSVAAMFFVESYYRNGDAPDAEQLGVVLAASRSPSLGPVGWGFVYPDLLRLLLPIHAIPDHIDRGWALEQAWRWGLPDPGSKPHPIDTRLSAWRARAREGRLPDVIFNSTIVESGKPLIMGTIEPAELANPERSDVFGTDGSAFEGSDLHVVTAARLASTFPYVTPVSRAAYESGRECRPDQACASHLADGGYFDNFGVYSAVQWLQRLMSDQKFTGKVVIVQIRAFGVASKSKSSKPIGRLLDNGWIDEVFGPPKTILNARESTQTVSDDQEIALLERAYGTRVQDFLLQPPPGTDQPPLSWMLSAKQRAQIDRDWCSASTTAIVRKLASAWGAPAADEIECRHL